MTVLDRKLGYELARGSRSGIDLSEIAHFPFTAGFSDCNRIPQLRRIDADEGFAMMSHDSPSLFEALPGLPGQPSFLHRGRVASFAEGHTV
jgi:hypothetical protein